MIAHPYDFSEVDEFDPNTGDPKCVIRMWCLDTENTPTVVTIRGFRPWCYVELPQTFKPNGFSTATPKFWNETDVSKLVEEFSERFDVKILSHKLVWKSKLHYYQPKRNSFPMIQLFFESIGDMRSISRKIEASAVIPINDNDEKKAAYTRTRGRFYGKYFSKLVFRAWEGDTAIPISRKMLTMLNMTYAGWFHVKPTCIILPSEKTEKTEGSEFTCKEIIVNASDLNELRNAFTSDVKPTPAASSPSVLAFDIETYTDNHMAMPNPLNPDHVAHMISCIYQRNLNKSTRKRFLIYLNTTSISSDLNHPAYKTTGIHVDEFIETKNEKELLFAFARLVQRLDPDIVTGYNTHGYDFKYLDTRYRLLVSERGGEWPSYMSRCKTTPVKLVSKKWKSGAYGYVESHTMTMDGRLCVDLLPIIKRDTKLSKYNLDTVSKHFLGDKGGGKHDVTAKQMFISYENAMETLDLSDTDPIRIAAVDEMTRVAAYAMQDSELVIDLFDKINVWFGLVELSSVAGVTVNDTFSRGQQCRIVSLLYDIACREDVILDKRKLPQAYKPKDDNNEAAVDDDSVIKYTGGAVQDPITGIHDNVICVDFSSLYPSIMIAFNISHDTLDVSTSPLEDKSFSGKAAVFDKSSSVSATMLSADCRKVTDSRYKFNNCESHEITFIEHSGGSGVDEMVGGGGGKKNKKQTDDDDSSSDDEDIDNNAGSSSSGDVRYDFKFATKDSRNGLLPRLVLALVEQRKAVRKEMSSGKVNDTMMTVLNQRQLAYKVTANSTYGFIGAQRGGSFPLVEGAMSVTARGRQLIGKVNEFVEDKYHGKIVYGDSVTGDTPIILRKNGIIFTRRFDEIRGKWKPLREGSDKEAFYPEDVIEVWTSPGCFKPIKVFIRHVCGKPIVRVLTHTGVVDCTTDHSLIRANGEKVKPSDVKIGDELMHISDDSYLMTELSLSASYVSEKEAFAMGLFAADGSCGSYNCPSGFKHSWAINNSDTNLLNKAAECLPFPTKILDTIKSSKVYKLVPIGCVKSVVCKYREMFYNEHREKRIPSCILTAPIETVRNFWNGFYAGDGDKKGQIVQTTCNFSQKGKEMCTGLWLIARRLGWKVSINDRIDKSNVFKLVMSNSEKVYRKCTSAIKKITPLTIINENSNLYVYDIEVADDSHRFNVGPGNLVISNTDSSMFVLPEQVKTAKDCNEWGHKLAQELSDLFPPPLKLEFEKAMRIICLKKKKYAALLIEPDGSYADKILTRGIVLARRDNCRKIRIVYEHLLETILRQGATAAESFKLIMETIAIMFRGCSSEDFEVVKSLGAEYKQKTFQMCVFAEECAKSGRPAAPGDRLGFVIVTEPSTIPQPGSDVKITNLGLMMRLTDVWDETQLPPIDILYYLSHMFCNPIDQLFEVSHLAELSSNGMVEKYTFKPRSNVSYSCSKPLKMLCAIIRHVNSTRARSKLPRLNDEEMAATAEEMARGFEKAFSKCN